jgi:hypothetical protein
MLERILPTVDSKLYGKRWDCQANYVKLNTRMSKILCKVSLRELVDNQY